MVESDNRRKWEVHDPGLWQEGPDAVIAPRIHMGGLVMSSSSATGVALQGLDPVAERVDALLASPELDVRNWRQALPLLAGMIEMDRASGDGMMIVIGLIVAFGVLNTLLMGVLERTREFGVMLSLGMKPRQIAGLVLLEGLVLGCLGAVVGLLAGLAFSYHAVHVGIDYAAFTGTNTMEMEGIVMDSVLKGAWDPVRMTIYFCSAIVFCLCAAAYPAWSISKLQPVEAMRHH